MQPNPIAHLLAATLADSPGHATSSLIVETIWLAVVDGSVDAGERLPTARELAVELRVSPRTVERAYEELERRGVLEARAGEGAFVRLSPPAEAELERRRELAALCRDVVERARALGCDVQELVELIAEYGDDERRTTITELRR
ncbi:MAG TPA: GntR family transcriptional regulator [Longimicrobiales bacterium]